MKLYLLSLFLLITCNAFARVQYSYDTAGNRIRRETVYNIIKPAKANTDKDGTLSEMLCERIIKVYPNPTLGLLKIAISPLEIEDDCDISIYNMAGKVIFSTNVLEDMTDIDLTAYKNGIYLLLIAINGENSVWKIIKE